MKSDVLDSIDRRPASWLALWALLIAIVELRWGLGALAWVMPLPALRYLRVAPGLKARAALVFVTVLAWTAAVVKIATFPIPPAMAPAFGLPLGLFTALPLLAYDGLRRRGMESPAVFASLMVLFEWSQHALTPFASWGAAAYTQVDNLPLLQVASVTGMAGVSWLVYFVAAQLEAWLAGTKPPRAVALAAGLVVAVMAAGHARMAVLDGGDTVAIAAIGTDSDATGEHLPDAETVAQWDAALAERTRRAAAAGAELAVWTEGSTVVLPADEQTFLARTGALASDANIEVVAGYIVPLPGEQLTYRNRYAWFSADGTLLHTYDKHNPVFGEPAVPGTGPMPLVEANGQRRSGAICYDYDYPRLGLQHAQLGADLVALPSSDWAGIDPIHTQMAALRAIEGGHSVLRSTRWGLSAGIDPTGRLRGWQSAFSDKGDGLLLVRLPRTGTTTVYGRLGDWFIVLCAAFSLLAALRSRH